MSPTSQGRPRVRRVLRVTGMSALRVTGMPVRLGSGAAGPLGGGASGTAGPPAGPGVVGTARGAGHPTGTGGRAGVPARGGERGSATVEAAIAVCAVVAVLAMALGGAATVLAQLRCTDAAREAARLVARGEQGRAAEVAGRIAPGGASVDIRIGGDEVVVVVTADPAGGLGLSVRAEAMAVLEPGVAGAG